MSDVIVIGGGIIGATIASALTQQGRQVLLIDSAQQLAGTRPSGGHLRPEWFGGMQKREYEPSMELLDAVWGLKKEQFTVQAFGLNTGISTTIYRVDTDQVMLYPKTTGVVKNIIDLSSKQPLVCWDTPGHAIRQSRCRLLIVAAGVWCESLLPEIKTQRKQGVSFRFKGTVKEPFVNPWAPYKQVVAHQHTENQIWIGDGSAILDKNWTKERVAQCLKRCQENVPMAELSQTLTGLRPYCESGKDPCLLKQLGPAAWVATGAGKSGTIAAGWAAWRISNASSDL